MAELVTIARPYAEALFSIAKQDKALSEWSETLSFIVAVYEDPQLQTVIASPTVTPADIERLIINICGSRINEKARNLIQLLVHNRRLPTLSEIRRLFDLRKAEEEGVVEAQIASAYAIEGKELDKIVSILSRRYQKNISPTVSVDSALIGGITVQIGDKVWDASVRGRLQEMATALTK